MTDYEDYKAELARWKQAVAELARWKQAVADDMTLLGFHTWLEHEAKALRRMTEEETEDKRSRREKT